jgi:hypothetical protein
LEPYIIKAFQAEEILAAHEDNPKREEWMERFFRMMIHVRREQLVERGLSCGESSLSSPIDAVTSVPV